MTDNTQNPANNPTPVQPVAPGAPVQPPQAQPPVQVPQPVAVQPAQQPQQPAPVGVQTQVTPPVAPGEPPKVVQQKLIGKYKVEVIREKCISAASCVAIAPQVFQLDEENLAKVIDQNGTDDEMKLLAAQSCPTAAIVVTDITTGQQVLPR